LNFQRKLQIFSDKFNFSAELFNCSVAVSNFRRNSPTFGRRFKFSAEVFNFHELFGIFRGTFETSATFLIFREIRFFASRREPAATKKRGTRPEFSIT